VAEEGAPGTASLGLSTDGFGNASVEPLDETVGLRPIRPGQAVIDLAADAEQVERVLAGGAAGRLVLHIDRKAIGELGAVVGKDRMNPVGEVSQKPCEEAGRSFGIAPSMDFDVDVTGGTIDSDESITFAPFQGRQMLQIDVDEADGGLFEDADAGLVRLFALADCMSLEAAMDGTARELIVDASSHHLDDIVQRQLQRCSQFADQSLFHIREACHQPVRPMRAVRNRRPAAPATDGGLTDPQFPGQLGHRLHASLDVGPDLRSRGRIGMQS
jgi:hypothetical protein